MMMQVLLITLLASFSSPFFGGEVIIQELEGLMKSLSEGDSQRRELTLRLADLYFFSAIDLDKQARLTEGDSQPFDKKASSFRQRSLNLYRKSISQYKLNRETQIKVEFQLARLLDQLGRKRKALSFWQKSYQQKQLLNIRREAILKFAEDAQKASRFAKAEEFYKEALTLCEDVCGFVHYRLGWVYRSQGKIIPALREVEQALWDNKGQIQEEVLRDYIAFLAQRKGNGVQEVRIVENLMERTGRKGLLEQLAFGFYSSGNNKAGTKALALVTQRDPTLKNQIRLLEEYYSLRHWDEFRELHQQIIAEKILALPGDAAKKIEQIMRRLAIQLEAEQKQSPELQTEFLAVNNLYLELFPQSEIAIKMMRSWLHVEQRSKVKMEKIAYWLGDKRRTFSTADEIALREERGRLAQEQKEYTILRWEMERLATIYTIKEKVEKAKYLIAHSYYQEEQLDKALPLFLELAKVEEPAPTKWVIQAQHLSLDIFNQKKDYQKLISQADLWLKQKWKLPSISKELADMRQIREQASFESAVAAGETLRALNIFYDYCQLGKFTPQSCQNAKRLSVILKDQSRLVAVLEKTQDKKALVNEYEISGYYTKAASLLTQKTPLLKKQWSFQEGIKIALLYELEGNFVKRDRWLKLLAKRYEKDLVPNSHENLLYSTLKDAGKLDVKSLSIRWSKNMRRRLILFLEESNNGNKKTRQEFLTQKESQGKLWEYFHLKKIYQLAVSEGSRAFYGKNSKRQFRGRLAGIKKLDAYTNKVLEKLSREGRIEVIRVLYFAYSNLKQEIRNTPIPEGIDAMALVKIKNQLAGIARPFGDKALSYKELLQVELSKVDGIEDQKFFLSEPIETKTLLAQLKRPQNKNAKTSLDVESVFYLLRQLKKDPFSQKAIHSLKELYLDRGQVRLSSYYEGRLQKIKADRR